MADSTYALAYEEALRGVVQQQTVLTDIRGRAATMLGVASISTSFLGGLEPVEKVLTGRETRCVLARMMLDRSVSAEGSPVSANACRFPASPRRLAYRWRPWIHAATVAADGDQAEPAAPPSSSEPWPAPSVSTTSRLARTGAAS
jgi:hypothetical protein